MSYRFAHTAMTLAGNQRSVTFMATRDMVMSD